MDIGYFDFKPYTSRRGMISLFLTDPAKKTASMELISDRVDYNPLNTRFIKVSRLKGFLPEPG